MIHHVCGDHEWAEGQCLHEAMTEPGEGKEWIDPASPAAETLRGLIFDRRWLNSRLLRSESSHRKFGSNGAGLLTVHVNNITHLQQAFHNLMTAYAPKRIGYKHDGYVARMESAYIDHNSHLDRPQMTTKDGWKVFSRKWSKRSARWHDVPVPSPKTYTYMHQVWMHDCVLVAAHCVPNVLTICIQSVCSLECSFNNAFPHCCLITDFLGIIAKSLYRRHMDCNATQVKSAVAKMLAPNIAHTPAPPTVELVEQHASRKRMRAAEI